MANVDSMPDLRLARVESMFKQGKWAEMHAYLQSQVDEAGDEPLPSYLSIFHALSQMEAALPNIDGQPTATARLIAAMDDLIGVPEGNPLGLFLAKRLVRKPPVTKRKTSWKTSAVAITLALAVGLGAGWIAFNFFPELIVLEAPRAN